MREVLDAESKRVNPQPPVGASQIWPAVEAQTNPAVSRNGSVLYVSLTNPLTGKTTAALVFTDRASGLVLESLAYCADIRYRPTRAAPARDGRPRSPVSASVDGTADAAGREDGTRVYSMAVWRAARAACSCDSNQALQGRA